MVHAWARCPLHRRLARPPSRSSPLFPIRHPDVHTRILSNFNTAMSWGETQRSRWLRSVIKPEKFFSPRNSVLGPSKISWPCANSLAWCHGRVVRRKGGSLHPATAIVSCSRREPRALSLCAHSLVIAHRGSPPTWDFPYFYVQRMRNALHSHYEHPAPSTCKSATSVTCVGLHNSPSCRGRNRTQVSVSPSTLLTRLTHRQCTVPAAEPRSFCEHAHVRTRRNQRSSMGQKRD